MKIEEIFIIFKLVMFIWVGVLVSVWSLTLFLLYTKKGRELCEKYEWLKIFIK
jgi:hypothetical protein